MMTTRPTDITYPVTISEFRFSALSSDAIVERDRRDFEDSLRAQAARLYTARTASAHSEA
jgi:hypothetical protein